MKWYRKAAEQGESAYTPATSLVAALAAALDYLRTVGDGEIEEGRKALGLRSHPAGP